MDKKQDRIEWMNSAEVGAEFGMSKYAIERQCHAGSIPSHQFAPGASLRIPRWWVEKELDRYRKGQSVEEYNTTQLAEKGRQIMQAIAAAQRLDLA